MKLYRNLLIPIIVLALLAGGVWFLLSSKPPVTPNPPDTKIETVYKVAQENLKKVTVKFEDFTLEFGQDKTNNLYLVKPKLYTAFDMIASVAYEMTNLSSIKVVGDNVINLSDFGFDTPYSISYILNNNQKKVFYFGRIAPDNSGIYFRENNSHKVYLMDLQKANTIFSDPNKLVNLTLFNVDETTFERMKVIKNGVLSFDLDTTNKADWRMLAPAKAPVSTSFIQDMYNSLAAIKVNGYLSGKLKPLDQYGLKNPLYVIDFKSKTEHVIIKLGITNQDGMIYGISGDSKRVFLIGSDAVGFRDFTTENAMMGLVNLQDISQVKGYVMTFNGKTDKVDISNINSKDSTYEKYVFNGQDVTSLRDENATQLFKALYESIISVRWSWLDFKNRPKLSKVDFKITYTLNDGSAYTLEFSRKDNNNYCVFRDGVYARLIVDKNQLNPVKKVRAELIKEAKNKEININ